MSNTIDAATNRFPVFGEDLVLTVASTSYADKLIVTSHSFDDASNTIVLKDGNGDTKARVFADVGGQADTLELNAYAVGADAAGAATNNARIARGTTISVASTKHPAANGDWKLDSMTEAGSNGDWPAWTIRLVKKL